jgi:hypothetical protein
MPTLFLGPLPGPDVVMLCKYCLDLFRVHQKRLIAFEAIIVHHFCCSILGQSGPLGCELCSLLLDQIKEQQLYNVVNTYCVVKPLKDEAEICYRDAVARYDSFTESSSSGKLLSVKFYGVPGDHSKGENQFGFGHKTLLECCLQAVEGEQITLLKSISLA